MKKLNSIFGLKYIAILMVSSLVSFSSYAASDNSIVQDEIDKAASVVPGSINVGDEISRNAIAKASNADDISVR